VSEEGAVEFATWSALSVLNELEFHAEWDATPTPDVLPLLTNCAALRGLTVLALRNVLLSEAAVAALLDSPHLVGLEVLSLPIEQATHLLSPALKSRLVARFGSGMFDDPIPF
jgi:hypothetical protein